MGSRLKIRVTLPLELEIGRPQKMANRDRRQTGVGSRWRKAK